MGPEAGIPFLSTNGQIPQNTDQQWVSLTKLNASPTARPGTRRLRMATGPRPGFKAAYFPVNLRFDEAKDLDGA